MLIKLAIKQHLCGYASLSSTRSEEGYFILLQLSLRSHELGQQLQRLCELVVLEPQFEVAYTWESDSACKLLFHYSLCAKCQHLICYETRLGHGIQSSAPTLRHFGAKNRVIQVSL